MVSPRNEFYQALKALANERGLDPAVIIEAMAEAIAAAYRRDAKEHAVETEGLVVEAEVDPISGEAKVFSYPEGEPEKRQEVTPPGFGRIAAITAKQVIHQKIREAEKGHILSEYEGKVGQVITGLVMRFDSAGVKVDLGKTEGFMPNDERIPSEKLNLGQRISFLLKAIIDTTHGKDLLLSRADPLFVSQLFAREVPEINAKTVEIKRIVREPGVRTKLTVASGASGVDPVGSCVGQKGVRVQAVTTELGGERIDIMQDTEDLAQLVASALAPAENLQVKISKDKQSALVGAPAEQLPKAVGRDGQNARLAAKLTGLDIKIESLENESTADVN